MSNIIPNKISTARARVTRLASVGLASSALLLVGCNSAGEGAVAGGFLGALGGLAIGALSGNEGDGAVIGAVSGAAIGGIIGDQNAQNNRSSYPRQRSGYDYDSGYNHRSGYGHSHRNRHRDPWWDDDCNW